MHKGKPSTTKKEGLCDQVNTRLKREASTSTNRGKLLQGCFQLRHWSYLRGEETEWCTSLSQECEKNQNAVQDFLKVHEIDVQCFKVVFQSQFCLEEFYRIPLMVLTAV